jgi:putative phosphoesterase
MKRIGVISDTHGSFEDRFAVFFKDCDELWHCGDVGDRKVLDKMEKIAQIRAVYGNIDGLDIRNEFPENQIFNIESHKVLITHIGGYPGRYEARVRQILMKEKPSIVLTGHSHILKVMPDKKYGHMHMNPGAAGNNGFHKIKTALRFVIDGSEIKDLQVLEVDRKQ